MAATTPLTDAERRKIARLHAAGHSCSRIAKELRRSRSTISNTARKLGLKFDRAKTAATQANVIDAKARRAQLAVELLTDAERLRGQLFTPTRLHRFGGKDNTYNSRDVDQPPFRDQREIMQATSTAITTSLRLDLHDTGADGAKSMLGALAAGLQVAYDQLQPEADDGGN